jgi:hypothetical protein
MELSKHLRDMAPTKGLSIAAIEAILNAPAIKYPSFRKDANGKRVAPMCERHNAQQEKWTGEAFGEKICVVVFPCCGKAVTAWKDQVETAVRPDQKKAGIKGYKGRDGVWRSA